MNHEEIKQKAIEYCNSKAEEGRSFNPLTVDDLVKFAESCNESAHSLSLREQAAISVLNSLLETTEHSIVECIAIRQVYAETAVLYADALVDALKKDNISKERTIASSLQYRKELQNPVEKVKAMYRIGEWVAANPSLFISPVKIVDVSDTEYRIEDTEGNSGVPRIEYLDKYYHRWTIQDANDGNILVNGSNIFMFHLINDKRLMGYCHVNTDNGKFYNDIGKNECFGLIDAVVTPATKEQRNLLFSKMKENGWESVAEKGIKEKEDNI